MIVAADVGPDPVTIRDGGGIEAAVPAGEPGAAPFVPVTAILMSLGVARAGIQQRPTPATSSGNDHDADTTDKTAKLARKWPNAPSTAGYPQAQDQTPGI